MALMHEKKKENQNRIRETVDLEKNLCLAHWGLSQEVTGGNQRS